MNAVILTVPGEVGADDLAEALADTGPVLRQPEDDRLLLDRDGKHVWITIAPDDVPAPPATTAVVADYYDITLVKDVVRAIAARWPDTVVDNDMDAPMPGRAFTGALDANPTWDWRA